MDFEQELKSIASSYGDDVAQELRNSQETSPCETRAILWERAYRILSSKAQEVLLADFKYNS